MTKDYKRSERKGGGRGSSLLIGILIGLVLGLGLALGVAWYINKMPSPFISPPAPHKGAAPGNGVPAAKNGPAQESETKPRFDFYKILPGRDDSAAVQPPPDTRKSPSTAPAKEAFFLQAGAFPNAADADNLKARLALLGVEATVQTTTIPDKGVWHRVRVGPYTSVEELNHARDTLKQNGIETTLVKARDAQ